MAVGIAHTVRGDPIHPWYCKSCAKVTTRYMKKTEIFGWCQKNGQLNFVKTSSQRRLESGQDNYIGDVACEVCGECGSTEYHHWAPRHLFGDECDEWPTADLCRACHLRWHQTVTPNMSKPKIAKEFL